ncbi:MAG: class III extradiol ring-cleavage dioxygenase, partial [Rhodocyclaceae bacterium]
VGSGAITHNLDAYRGASIDEPVPSWVSAFAEWIHGRIEAGERELLLDYRTEAPFAVRNHPSEEHLLPLYVAMGAAGSAPKGQRIHGSYQYGVLAMDMYAFS